jgi:hypothetical protein
MYVTYLDDSGTHSASEIAIAACYVSTESGWRNFVREWDRARVDEGFDCFHMAEFVAPAWQGHKPWCDWTNEKKTRVYSRLARTINENKRIGVGVAVPKSLYDKVPDKIRDHYGYEHYTFAVRMCLMQILQWRQKSLISQPMKYVFDWEEAGTPKRREISELLTNVHEKLKPLFGLDTGGFDFARRQEAKPLQAADILAWQMNSYMPKIYPAGETNFDFLREGFKILREDQEVELGYFSESNIESWINRCLESEEKHGEIC